MSMTYFTNFRNVTAAIQQLNARYENLLKHQPDKADTVVQDTFEWLRNDYSGWWGYVLD